MKVRFTYNNGRERKMDSRHAKVLERMGRGTYMTRDMQAQAVSAVNQPSEQAETAEEEGVFDEDSSFELSALRSKYQEVVGKRAFHGWDADTLRDKIAEAGEQ